MKAETGKKYQSTGIRKRKPLRKQLICNVWIRFNSKRRHIWKLQKLWVKSPHIRYKLHFHHHKSQSHTKPKTHTKTIPRSPFSPINNPKKHKQKKPHHRFPRKTNLDLHNFPKFKSLPLSFIKIRTPHLSKFQLNVSEILDLSRFWKIAIFSCSEASYNQDRDRDQNLGLQERRRRGMRWNLEESSGDFSEIRDDCRCFRHFCRGSRDRAMKKAER